MINNENGNSIKVSVAMATFNGEKYIYNQIESILSNLNHNDEIIISDDGSTDETKKIVCSFNDSRIKIYDGPRAGVVKNFENAIEKCQGDYIFLSDQDDVWRKDKVKVVLKTFRTNDYCAIVHNAYVKNSDLSIDLFKSYFDFRKIKKGKIANIIAPAYLGCCMAFKREMKTYILPFPQNIEMHDRWIGAVCNKIGEVGFIDDKLIIYRRHENNSSQMHRNSIATILINRITLLYYLASIK